MPQAHDPLHDLISGVVDYVSLNAVRFCMNKDVLLGVWYRDVFLTEYDKYDGFYLMWKNPATRTVIASDKLREAEKRIAPVFRELFAFLKGNPLVDGSDLDAMRLPGKHDREHRPTPVAYTAPSFHINAVEGNRLRIFYHPEGTKRRSGGKPHGQHGVEIRWGFSDDVVKDPDALAHSLFDTASPYTLKFNPNDYGKIVNIALRWENNRGVKGPWSVVVRANVP
jgi:hypothetical protein